MAQPAARLPEVEDGARDARPVEEGRGLGRHRGPAARVGPQGRRPLPGTVGRDHRLPVRARVRRGRRPGRDQRVRQLEEGERPQAALLVGTLGLLIAVVVTPASVLDRDAAPLLLAAARRWGRARLALAWADNAYHGAYQDWSAGDLGITVEIVDRAALGDGRKGNGFQVVPRRWVVERTNAWISRRRRCARDYERLSGHHAAMVQLAAIIQMTRRAARTATTAAG